MKRNFSSVKTLLDAFCFSPLSLLLGIVVFVLLASCEGDDQVTTFPDASHPRLVSAVSTKNTEIPFLFSQ